MKNSLYEAISSINIDQIDDSDKLELIQFFLHTNSPLIRNQIALIFSDMNYTHAIPSILKKITEKELYNANGTLVFALQAMNTIPYFIDIVKIICEQGYEARLAAFDIIQKDANMISNEEKIKALKVLEKYKSLEILNNPILEENSRLHFIEEVEKLLSDGSTTLPNL